MNKNPRFFLFDYYYQIKPSLSGTEKSGNLLLPNQSFINLGGWPKYRQCHPLKGPSQEETPLRCKKTIFFWSGNLKFHRSLSIFSFCILFFYFFGAVERIVCNQPPIRIKLVVIELEEKALLVLHTTQAVVR